MNKFFRVWFQLFKLNVLTWMEYRIDFIVGIIAVGISNLQPIVFFWAIFSKVPSINGWTFEQVLFLSGFSVFTFGIWHVFISGISPHRLDRKIRQGDLDRLLVRPINTAIYLIQSRIDDYGFGDLIGGLLIMVWASNKLGMIWTLQSIFLLISMVSGGVMVTFSIYMIFATIGFWTVRIASIEEIVWRISTFTDYPLDIYNPFIIFFLSCVVPFGFVNYYPAQLFLGKGIWMQGAYLTPFVGLIMVIIAYSFWKVGLKNYTSVGH